MLSKPGVRVKFCGLTQVADVQAAVELGVDAIGLVFYAASPRAVTITQAQELLAVLPSGAARPSSIGLFVDPEPAAVAAVLDQVPLDLIQFHGDESAARCRAAGLPYLKAIRMQPGLDPAHRARRFPDAFGLLLDTYQPGVPGGTGIMADLSCVSPMPGRRIILAGGLNADNVGAVVRAHTPYAVDVSSGIELSPGTKSREQMSAFMEEVRYATANCLQADG